MDDERLIKYFGTHKKDDYENIDEILPDRYFQLALEN